MIIVKKYGYVVYLILANALVSGCDNKHKEDEKLKLTLTQEINASMVTIDGGRFQMGDFGPLVGDKLPFSPDIDNKPLHWVNISDFRMTKNRITWKQFNEWLRVRGRDKTHYYTSVSNNKYAGKFQKYLGDTYPASVVWQDAKEFCQWFGNVSGRNISLPTEAQWEFAARAGGEFRLFANNDNLYNEGDPNEKLNFTHTRMPVGSYPSNPLGLYDMMGNGNEWMNDWYAEQYYQVSPMNDPQGPEYGDKKVLRGYLGSMFGLYSITRGKLTPSHEGPNHGFRCVENSPFK